MRGLEKGRRAGKKGGERRREMGEGLGTKRERECWGQKGGEGVFFCEKT